MKSLDLLIYKNLNFFQFKVVEFIDKPLLVLAGAGSGKTRVITYKIAHLILSRKRFNKVEASMPGLFFRHAERLLDSSLKQKICVT